MRPLILLSCCLLLSFTAFAQESFNKSTVLGGNLNFSTRNSSADLPMQFSPVLPTGVTSLSQEIRLTNFSINPYLGREISPNFMFGFRLNYEWIKTRSEVLEFDPLSSFVLPAVITNRHQIGGGVFARFIFAPYSTIHFFIQPAVNYGYTTTIPSISSEMPMQGQVITASISPGIGYNINQRWRLIALLTGARYSYMNERVPLTNQTNTSSQFDFLVNLSGFQLGAELRL